MMMMILFVVVVVVVVDTVEAVVFVVTICLHLKFIQDFFFFKLSINIRSTVITAVKRIGDAVINDNYEIEMCPPSS